VTTFVALLRAVNVGSTNRIKMVDLRAAFVQAGYADAVTYIQTGNVIFSSDRSEQQVKAAAELVIHARLGLSITALVRSAADLRRIAAFHPLGDDGTATGLHVCFLDAAPAPDRVASFARRTFTDASSLLIGREMYLRYRSGAGTSKLTNALIETKLGVPATTRNWNVTTALAEVAGDPTGGAP
jgi:uncharacterized protein (DUF1697 family)